MAKTVLKISEESKFDFVLIGIICNHRDYRLCKELNRKLEISLSKQDEYTVFSNKRMEDQAFSFYEYLTEDEDRFNLIANRCPKGTLLPEQNQVDYLFLVRPGRMNLDEQELISNLKEIPLVLGAYKLDTAKLKSRDNLVF